MDWKRRWLTPVAGSALALALAVGTTAYAQNPEATPAATMQVSPQHHGEGAGPRGGPHGDKAEHGAALADALGITVEELQAAHESARAAQIAQGVADGRLTQDEADALLSGEHPAGRPHGEGHRGPEGQAQFLADALGIPVEELEAAHDQVRADKLAEAVASGELTQQQADLMAARAALADYVDHEGLLADALGMSVAELEAAKAEGQRLPEIIAAQALDEAAVRAAMQAGVEAAVQQAVADGVITQAQADALLSDEQSFRGPGGRPHGPGGPRGDGERGGHPPHGPAPMGPTDGA